MNPRDESPPASSDEENRDGFRAVATSARCVAVVSFNLPHGGQFSAFYPGIGRSRPACVESKIADVAGCLEAYLNGSCLALNVRESLSLSLSLLFASRRVYPPAERAIKRPGLCDGH
jgi:hypothetical protein